MPTSTWKGYISFGLISVPIRLFPAARYSHIAFHEIHRKCGHRVHQQLYCPYDEEVVSREDVAMGYEIAKDKYVLIDPDELKTLQPPSSTAMEIVQFVKLTEVDPIYFETSYFSVPDQAGTRGYSLLLQTMEELNYAALAQVTLHQKERTVILRPYEGGLIVHTIYYPNEIREVKDYGKASAKDLKKKEIELAAQFAKELVKPFRPEQFHDEYSERVQKLVDSKAKGKPGPKPDKTPVRAPVIDLMTALKKSIASAGKKTPDSGPKKLRKSA